MLDEEQIVPSREAQVATEDTASLKLSGKGAGSLSKISLYVNGDLLTDDIQANESGEWNFTWLGTEEGFEIVLNTTYTITVEQTDTAGNVSEISDSYNIKVERVK